MSSRPKTLVEMTCATIAFAFPLLLLLAASCAPAPTKTPSQMQPLWPPFRALALGRGIRIGAAVATRPLQSEPLYAETLAREFSMVTPENAMKFGPLRPSRERYDFRDADTIVDFAEAHGMTVRGHTLVWEDQLPSWLTAQNWPREELIDILREHILTVVGRYRGRVVAWDVVNEAVTEDGSLKDTFWLRGIGPTYIEMAFGWAHEADPAAMLFYNDLHGEGQGRKSDAIYALVQSLLQRGVPIHGVGFQMHVHLGRYPTPQHVAANMTRLAALGLQVHVTEMDVGIQGAASAGDLSAQARIYRDTLGACLSVRGCTAFVLWGFTDRHSWISQFFPGWGTALIFDEAYHPKPAYNALRDMLRGP